MLLERISIENVKTISFFNIFRINPLLILFYANTYLINIIDLNDAMRELRISHVFFHIFHSILTLS